MHFQSPNTPSITTTYLDDTVTGSGPPSSSLAGGATAATALTHQSALSEPVMPIDGHQVWDTIPFIDGRVSRNLVPILKPSKECNIVCTFLGGKMLLLWYFCLNLLL